MLGFEGWFIISAVRYTVPELTSPGAFLREICTTWCLQIVRCPPELTALPKMNFKPEKLKSVRQYLVSKQTWCLMSTETIRLIRDREKGVKGLWR